MPSKGFTSLREIAEKAGVSVSAVSLALRNSPKISAMGRRKIQQIAAKLGYQQDPRISELMVHLRQAREVRSRSQMAVLVPELARHELENHPRLQALIAGVQSIAAPLGFGVDVICLGEAGMSCQIARRILLARGIKGVVVAPFVSGTAKLAFDFSGFCAATAGYSIIEPALHRACPDYLRMMDGMLAMCVAAKFQRIGLVMTKKGGTGFKLYASSFLYFQSSIASGQRVPILSSHEGESGITAEHLRAWLHSQRPDVVIGAAHVLPLLENIGASVPSDISFVSFDVSEPPTHAAGADHCYEMVGQEAFKLMLTSLNLNLTGTPEHPRIVLVDSHIREGTTLIAGGKNQAPAKKKARNAGQPPPLLPPEALTERRASRS